jgi:hypothetical protein
VYWSGEVGRDELLKIVQHALRVLVKHPYSIGVIPPVIGKFISPVAGKFIAYGENMREEIPIAIDGFRVSSPSERPKKPSPLKSFKAGRAEITNPSGTVVIWANVSGHVRGELGQGGENIGVALPPDLFDGPAREIVVYAIRMTMKMRPEAISSLLDKFAETLLQRRRPAAG